MRYALEVSKKIDIGNHGNLETDINFDVVGDQIFLSTIEKLGSGPNIGLDDYTFLYKIFSVYDDNIDIKPTDFKTFSLEKAKGFECSSGKPKKMLGGEFSIFVFCISENILEDRQLFWRFMFKK